MAITWKSLTILLIWGIFSVAATRRPSKLPWTPASHVITCDRFRQTSQLQDAEIGSFEQLPENKTCQKNQSITLFCLPYSNYDSITWYVYTKHVYWTASDNTEDESSLTLDCGTYVVECVYFNSERTEQHLPPHTSGLTYISEADFILQPTNATCHLGGSHVFSCVTGNPYDVIRTIWTVDGLNDVSIPTFYDGLQLEIPCVRKYNNSNIRCVVCLHGGNITSPPGWLKVFSNTSTNTIDAVGITKEPMESKECSILPIIISTIIVIVLLLLNFIETAVIIHKYKNIFNLTKVAEGCHSYFKQKLDAISATVKIKK